MHRTCETDHGTFFDSPFLFGDWLEVLCALKSEGWSYAYSRSVDWEKEETCWIVEMARNGVHYSVGRPSFEEAVRAACDFIKDNFEKSKDRFYQ